LRDGAMTGGALLVIVKPLAGGCGHLAVLLGMAAQNWRWADAAGAPALRRALRRAGVGRFLSGSRPTRRSEARNGARSTGNRGQPRLVLPLQSWGGHAILFCLWACAARREPA